MKCRSCGSDHITKVVDLGFHRLADFPAPEDYQPDAERFPLKLMICLDCTLVQLEETTSRAKLYHERYGFRSGTNEAIRNDLQSIVADAMMIKSDIRRWLDIACNDGTLLGFVPRSIHRTGIDPVHTIAQEARRFDRADRVVYNYFSPVYFQPGEFDVITSVSVFYDLDDPNQFVHGVKQCLAPGGVWIIQQNYAGDMLTSNAIDNVCHEHVTYFALLPLMVLLERHGLEINNVTFSSVNGGCIRTVVSRIGERPVSASVQDAYEREVLRGLHRADVWQRWGEQVKRELSLTRNFLLKAKEQGQTVYLYGASTRGGTILQMLDAGPELLPYAVERSPAKVGKIMSSTGIPIISEEAMRNDHPDFLLVSPWFFKSVFVRREWDYLSTGGRMIFPLSQFEIVGKGSCDHLG